MKKVKNLSFGASKYGTSDIPFAVIKRASCAMQDALICKKFREQLTYMLPVPTGSPPIMALATLAEAFFLFAGFFLAVFFFAGFLLAPPFLLFTVFLAAFLFVTLFFFLPAFFAAFLFAINSSCWIKQKQSQGFKIWISQSEASLKLAARFPMLDSCEFNHTLSMIKIFLQHQL